MKFVIFIYFRPLIRWRVATCTIWFWRPKCFETRASHHTLGRPRCVVSSPGQDLRRPSRGLIIASPHGRLRSTWTSPGVQARPRGSARKAHHWPNSWMEPSRLDASFLDPATVQLAESNARWDPSPCVFGPLFMVVQRAFFSSITNHSWDQSLWNGRVLVLAYYVVLWLPNRHHVGIIYRDI